MLADLIQKTGLTLKPEYDTSYRQEVRHNDQLIAVIQSTGSNVMMIDIQTGPARDLYLIAVNEMHAARQLQSLVKLNNSTSVPISSITTWADRENSHQQIELLSIDVQENTAFYISKGNHVELLESSIQHFADRFTPMHPAADLLINAEVVSKQSLSA